MMEGNLKTRFSMFHQINVNNLKIRVHGEHITMSFLIYKLWESVQTAFERKGMFLTPFISNTTLQPLLLDQPIVLQAG